LTAITQHGPDLWQISLPFQGEEQIIGPYLLAGNGELALIDPGPGSTLEALLEGIKQMGFAPEDITHLLATHIHLDHAGSAGSLALRLPRAQVYAHSKGAPHLLDTTKVVASASRIYGDRMKPLWGEIESVPKEQLQTFEDGDVLNVAGHRLEVHYAPGHAVHHVVFLDSEVGSLFAGDVAGVKLPGVDYVRPPTPPPDLDLEDWSASMELVKRLKPTAVYMAHFGPAGEIEDHFARLHQKLYTWGDFILKAMRHGKSEAEIIRLLIEESKPELMQIAGKPHDFDRYDLATNYPMTVQGYIRYWTKKHPEKLT
jgi:glyoxylase-like metal-dependent hydrolase (beta-lactamase superfamily II)